jgi:hypothetical protein
LAGDKVKVKFQGCTRQSRPYPIPIYVVYFHNTRSKRLRPVMKVHKTMRNLSFLREALGDERPGERKDSSLRFLTMQVASQWRTLRSE